MNGKWTVGAKIAEGACGEVYELQETDPAIGQLVVKCIALPDPKSSKAQQKAQSRIADTLYYENVLYTNGLFHGFIQSAKVPRGAYGEDHGVRYLVMERLGLPLSSWATLTGSVTPAKVATIGLQILAGLEFIHNKVIPTLSVRCLLNICLTLPLLCRDMCILISSLITS